MVFSGAAGQKTFRLPFSPVEVMADADEKISDAATDEIKIIKSTGEYDFGETFCNIRVKNINDSAMVRIVHNWVGPESTGTLQAGTRISDSRYWTVQGIFPPGFSAQGEFVYKAAESFNNSLITDSADLMVLLFRTNAGQPWKAVPFTRTGSRREGTITVDTLRRGDYVFGVKKFNTIQKTEKQ